MELVNPKFKKLKKSVWVIIHVNVDFLYRMEKDLDKYAAKLKLGKGEVNSYVPTVRILRKRLKGNMIFETIPLLFTYGFIQMPKHLAIESNISLLKTTVTAIHSFVSDRSNGNKIGLATAEEINSLYKNLIDYSVYDKADLEKLKPGSVVTLVGYPFDNLDAEIIKVDKETQKVKVKFVDESSLFKTAEVEFDNIIWSEYHSRTLEQGMKEESLDGIRLEHKQKKSI